MRTWKVKSEAVRKQLDLLVRPSTPPDIYQSVMRELGMALGKRIDALAGHKRRCLVVCTPEDADFLAVGLLKALSSSVKELGFACFWHHRSRPDVPKDTDLDLDVAPIVKRYEEPTAKSLDFIVIVKSIISSGCVVKHNLLDLIDRKEPAEIFVAAPVIYRGADKALKCDFPVGVSKRFRFVYFAEDDTRDRDGIVSPGIGGNVYRRLGLSEREQTVPSIVKERRHQQAERVA
jgi:hypothetical protein